MSTYNLCFSLFFFVFSYDLLAVTGTVRAAQGLGISGARIESNCGGFTYTDDTGRFNLDAAAGCELTVTAESFVRRMVMVHQSSDIVIDLQIDPLVQTVTVMESSPLVLSSPEVSKAIDNRTLAELPSINRDINRFAMLDPRVRNTSSLASDGLHSTRLTINGLLFRYTQYELDGAANYEPVLGNGPQQPLSIAAVAEYKVYLNQFGAERGRTSAGVISAITRAGGDAWHGEAFYFLRPSGIQAAPPVSIFRVPNERHQFGGAAGGPITQKLRTFASIENGLQKRGSFIQSPFPSFFVGEQTQIFGLVNTDYRFNDRQSVYLRLNASGTWNSNLNDLVGGFVQPSARQQDLGQNAGGQLTHRWLLGSGVNQFRIGLANSIPLSFYPVESQVRVVRPNFATEGANETTYTRVWSGQVGNLYSWEAGRHNLRIGGDFIRHKVRDLRVQAFGEYRFAPGPPVAGQQPIQYIQTFGQEPVRYGDTLTALYFQDDWKALPRLTLNLGVRHDYQSVGGATGNFSPRLGFAWSLNKSGNTVLRGGFGIFYNQVFLQVVRGGLQQGPASNQATYTIAPTNPGFPIFPQSLTAPPTGPANIRNLFVVPSRFDTPYSVQTNLGIQQVLFEQWTLSINAIYTQSQKLLRTYDINAPSFFPRTAPGQTRTAAAADATRPLQTFEGLPVRRVDLLESSGWGRYAGLDAQLARRFSRGFQAMVHYLYNSSMTNSFFTGGPGTGAPEDWSNPSQLERGMTDFHQRHRIAGQSIWEGPWGLQFATMLLAASGLPVNPLTGVDNNGDGNFSDRAFGFGRNSFRGPAQISWDLSGMKRIVWKERFKLELRAEFLNVLNRSNYLRVNSTFGNGPAPLSMFLQPIAGVTNNDPSRQIQFGTRLLF